MQNILKVKDQMLEEKGQGLVEYALIIGFVALAVFAILSQLGGPIVAIFNNLLAGLEKIFTQY